MSRLRRVDNRQEFERVIDDYITQGYKVKSRGEMSAQLKEKDYGSLGAHAVIFIIFGWWTLFVANVIYAAIKYSGADSVTVKINQPQGGQQPQGQPVQQQPQNQQPQGQLEQGQPRGNQQPQGQQHNQQSQDQY